MIKRRFLLGDYSLRAHLVALALAVALPIIAVSLLSFQRFYDGQRAALESRLQETARALLLTVDRELNRTGSVAMSLAAAPELQADDVAGFLAHTRDAVQLLQGAVVVLTDGAGHQVANSLRPYGTPLAPRTEPGSIERVFATGQPQITNLYRGGISQRWTAMVDVPVRRAGQIVYALSLSIDFTELNAILASQRIPEDWVASVLDGSGRIVARTRNVERFIGTTSGPKVLNELALHGEGIVRAVTVDGTPVYSSFSRSRVSGWTVVYSVPLAALDAGLAQALRELGLAAGAMLLLAILLALLVGRRIAGAIYDLAAAAQAVGQGLRPALPRPGLREASRVGQALIETSHLIDQRALERDRAEEQLRMLNETLEQRVSLRTAELADANRKLGDANRKLVAEIEERRRLEEARRRTEDDYRLLYHSVPIPLHSLDIDGRILSVSDRWIEFLGFQRDQVVGRSIADFLTADSARHHRERAWPGFLRDGIIRDSEYRVVKQSGELADVLMSALIVRDEAGRFVRSMGALIDVTARKQAEAALRHAQKIEAVGQLTSGIAHDFNNLLAATLGNLELIEGRTDDPVLLKFTGGARRAAERGARLTEQLLAFSRKQILQVVPVELNRLIARMEDLLSRTIGSTIQITTMLEPNLWPVLIDPHQIELAILNLAINARDAMPMGGTLVIETANLPPDDPRRPEYLEASPAETPGEPSSEPSEALDHVMIAVTDSGTGMTEAVQARVFEPFFTTKEVGRGSGLGLSMVYGLVQQSNGHIRIASAPDRGTTVRLFLPRSRLEPPPAVPPAPAPVSEAAQRQTHASAARALEPVRVLLVDDDAAVREFAASCLEDLGYQVSEAVDGLHALERLSDDPTFDLLIADIGMPGMSGFELARAATARVPGLAVLFISGYTDQALLAGDARGAQLLKKPFRIADLGAAVLESLRRGARLTGAQ